MKNNVVLKNLLTFLLFWGGTLAFGTDISVLPTTLTYTGGNTWYFVERSNWSQYVNGKYIGLTHRENRASVSVSGTAKAGVQFSGHFYVLEETLRDMSHSSRKLDEIREVAFTVSPSGKMSFSLDTGFPQLRSVPVYPDKPVQKGDKWQAEGTRVVEPRNNGKKSVLPILVEYEFIGSEIYRDAEVFRIKARYAMRMNKYIRNKNDDPELQNATGTHELDILVDAETGAAILILDRLDETFSYSDGGTVRFKGSTAIFSETPIPVQHDTLIPKIGEITAEATKKIPEKTAPVDDLFGESKRVGPEPSIKKSLDELDDKPFIVEETPQGIRLSIRDIRFLPDSDSILENEAWRLDAIAQTLRLVKNGRFLIEGHTASVGKTEGEKELSIQRAQKIVVELSKRGLSPEQFLFAGYGGTRPIADNSTAAGRAQNRRVEITILE